MNFSTLLGLEKMMFTRPPAVSNQPCLIERIQPVHLLGSGLALDATDSSSVRSLNVIWFMATNTEFVMQGSVDKRVKMLQPTPDPVSSTIVASTSLRRASKAF